MAVKVVAVEINCTSKFDVIESGTNANFRHSDLQFNFHFHGKNFFFILEN